MQAQRLSPDSSRDDLQTVTGAGCCGLRPFYPSTSTSPLEFTPIPPKRGYVQSCPCKRISSSLQVFKFLPQYLLTHPNADLCSNKVSKEVEQYTIVLRRDWCIIAELNLHQRTIKGLLWEPLLQAHGECRVRALQWWQNHHFHLSPQEKTLKNI